LSTLYSFLSIVRYGVDQHYCSTCFCRCNRIAAS